ncbi:MAG: DUF4276 family protein [Gammaproteobacteria bacterium]|jgi:hypothetical protein|nr:DUF4276 family protein [Gammaproteobacteria bacterium]MBT4607492.1 DUF4276 family protein [Thiotrichales bacterium]MBT3472165.1 DUF4276 family protein [Gammaproteobacteria bacterium]MBT3967288.1 DUF4276 family protein [Gammaproteobacteria bacterium]MBT4079264.1 DUF4276 family protein [Gammaproteobacteria bacterium]
MQLVFFLEEPSAKAMLQGVLPKILPAGVQTQFVVFDGKQDLEKRLPLRLRAWQRPDAKFIVMRDQDSGNCKEIKAGLVQKCLNAGKEEHLVRIACHELESFYLGDLAAVAEAIGPNSLARQQNRAKYRDPDRLANPSQELKKMAPSYQKMSGSRAIGLVMDVEGNRSYSFNMLLSGVKRLAGVEQ